MGDLEKDGVAAKAFVGKPKAQAKGSSVKLKFGIYKQDVPNMEGKTVAELRNEFADNWNIPQDAVAYSGRQRLEDNEVLQGGQQVQFHRAAGQKG